MRVDFPTFLKRYTREKDRFPFGIRLYDGVQGAGKSLSMVYDMRKIYNEWNDTCIVSNIKLVLPKEVDYRYYEEVDELINILNVIEYEQKRHVLVIIDEGLTYFAENGGIDPALMNKITQNRKNRRLIMISVQKFKRLNNRLRDFSMETVVCSNLGFVQINQVRDDKNLKWDKEAMDFLGEKKYTYIFKRNDDLFRFYDTNQIIKLNKDIHTGGLLGDKPPPSSPAEVVGVPLSKNKVKIRR